MNIEPIPPPALTEGGPLDIHDAAWVIIVTPDDDNPGRLDCWMLNNVPLDVMRLHLLEIIDGIDAELLRGITPGHPLWRPADPDAGPL